MKTLIVIDMQNDFIDEALGTPEAQVIVPNVKKKIEEYDAREDAINKDVPSPSSLSSRISLLYASITISCVADENDRISVIIAITIVHD